MNLYMRVDLEGVSGVVSYEQAEPGKSEYAFGQRMLTGDVNAAVGGGFEGGANRVVIYDMHCDGRNIPLDQLDPRAELVCGKPKPAPDFVRQFDALMLIGFHGKAGGGTLLAHSYEGDTLDIRVNGVSVGEIGLEAAIAGEFGLPVVLLTGDSAGCAEMKALSPETRTVEVKTSLSARGGLCFPCEVTRGNIRMAAAAAVRQAANIKPFSLGAFRSLEIDLPTPLPIKADRLNKAPDAATRGKTITIKADTLYEAWHRYRWLRGAPDGG
jgi:D-amino peptidase